MEKETIYRIMNGDMDRDQVSLPEDICVVDEFSENRECEQLYDRVYAAKVRLSERLKVNEDEDVEEIIGCMSNIARILAYKMYDYGAKSERADKA